MKDQTIPTFQPSSTTKPVSDNDSVESGHSDNDHSDNSASANKPTKPVSDNDSVESGHSDNDHSDNGVSANKPPVSGAKIKRRKCIKRNTLCPFCHKRFESKRKVSAHVRESHPGCKFTCSFCSKQYDTHDGQRKHEKSHSYEDFRYSCSDCEYKFQFKFKLLAHTHIHKCEEQIQCTKCDQKYASFSAMSAHLTNHTSVNKYLCDRCDHKTSSQSNLDQHIRGKHGEGWTSDCGK